MWEEVGTEDLDKTLEFGKGAALPLSAALRHTLPAIGQFTKLFPPIRESDAVQKDSVSVPGPFVRIRIELFLQVPDRDKIWIQIHEKSALKLYVPVKQIFKLCFTLSTLSWSRFS